MFTANHWTEVRLVMGTVVFICYKSGQVPPQLPVSVMVQFDCYRGPILPDGTVPIRHTWFTAGGQLPLKLVWAVTIHKAQGLALDKVVIDVGKSSPVG